jgi:hypothetical protein
LSRHQTIHLLSRVGHPEPPWQVRRGRPHLRVACIYSALGADAAGVALSGRCTIVYATDVDPNLHLQYGVNKTLFPVTVTEDNDLLTPDGRAKAKFMSNVQSPRHYTNPSHTPNHNPDPNPSHLEPKALAGIRAAQADTTVAAPVCRLVRFCLTPSRCGVIIS